MNRSSGQFSAISVSTKGGIFLNVLSDLGLLLEDTVDVEWGAGKPRGKQLRGRGSVSPPDGGEKTCPYAKQRQAAHKNHGDLDVYDA